MKEYYCSSCCHYTEPVGSAGSMPCCKWCGSKTIGIPGRPLKPDANSGKGRTFTQQPDVYRQIHYAEKFRLIKGFYILDGGEI